MFTAMAFGRRLKVHLFGHIRENSRVLSNTGVRERGQQECSITVFAATIDRKR